MLLTRKHDRELDTTKHKLGLLLKLTEQVKPMPTQPINRLLFKITNLQLRLRRRPLLLLLKLLLYPLADLPDLPFVTSDEWRFANAFARPVLADKNFLLLFGRLKKNHLYLEVRKVSSCHYIYFPCLLVTLVKYCGSNVH